MKINEDLTINGTNKTLKALNAEVENLKGYVLFNSENGTASNITLSDSAENYTYLEIYLKNLYNECDYYFKVYKPNGKVCKLNYLEISSNKQTTAQAVYENSHLFSYPFKINGTSITRIAGQTSDTSQYSSGLVALNGTYKEADCRISFLRVVGYK